MTTAVAALAAVGGATGGCTRSATRQPVRPGVVLVRPATRAATVPAPVQSSPVAGVPVTRTPVSTAGPVTTGPTVVAVVPRRPPVRPAATRPADVATADLSDPYRPVPGLAKRPKPFVKLPDLFPSADGPAAKPSTALLTHLSPDSPVSIADYAKQPVFELDQFRLTPRLTVTAVQRKFGLPAALADADDPWFVYRLVDGRELWLHFTTAGDRLRSADVIHGVEDGYERKTVFP